MLKFLITISINVVQTFSTKLVKTPLVNSNQHSGNLSCMQVEIFMFKNYALSAVLNQWLRHINGIIN